MVHSSALTVTTDGEHLTYGGFSLKEIVRFRSLEFNADCFSILSLSLKESDSGAGFWSATHSGPPPPWDMIEDSIEEFYIASTEEGGYGLPPCPRHGTGPTPAPIATTP
jgi:hypothetical protein